MDPRACQRTVHGILHGRLKHAAGYAAVAKAELCRVEKFAAVGLLSPVGCWLINARRCRVEVISRDPWQVFCQAPRATVQLPLAAVCSTTAAAADSAVIQTNSAACTRASMACT